MVISDTIKELKEQRDTLVSDRNYHLRTLEGLQQESVSLNADLTISKQAQEIIRIVAQATQSNLKFHIETLVSSALLAVDSANFPTFVAEFVPRRNNIECDLLFEENGHRYNPMEGGSGGAKNIAAFATRISTWQLRKNRKTFVLDEPFKDVSPDLQQKVSEMLKMIYEKLGILIIMVSLAADINKCSNLTVDLT